jgi:type II secretory ATPase GspE/PulE/Tfp pilus assembly ATPase PilB-like protein
MSGLDISEKRLPQDGRFNIKVRNNMVDVRISTMPTQYGESVVMRLLNQNTGLLGLDRLGMPPRTLERCAMPSPPERHGAGHRPDRVAARRRRSTPR